VARRGGIVLTLEIGFGRRSWEENGVVQGGVPETQGSSCKEIGAKAHGSARAKNKAEDVPDTEKKKRKKKKKNNGRRQGLTAERGGCSSLTTEKNPRDNHPPKNQDKAGEFVVETPTHTINTGAP